MKNENTALRIALGAVGGIIGTAVLFGEAKKPKYDELIFRNGRRNEGGRDNESKVRIFGGRRGDDCRYCIDSFI